MRQSTSLAALALSVLALGCEGELIDRSFPTTPSSPPPSPPSLAFRLGDAGSDIVTDLSVDPAGNLYLAGTFTGSVDFDPGAGVTSLTSLGGEDVFVAKYSAAGVFVWVARIGGIGEERVTSLARDPAGNLYIGGAFEGSTDFDPGAGARILTSLGGEDGFAVRLSPEGALVWSHRFGGVSADRVTGVATDAAGRSYVTGIFTGSANPSPALGPTLSANSSGQDAFLLGLAASGAIDFLFPIGGPQDDVANAIAVTAGGLVVVGGSFRAGAAFAPGSSATQLTAQGGGDAFLAGYDGLGELQWARALSGLGDEEIRAGGLAADTEGGIVATGSFSGTTDFDPGIASANRTSLGARDWFAARYDGLGGFRSVFSVGTTGSDPAPRPAADPEGTLLLTGWWSGPMDFDPGAGSTVVASLGSSGATDVFTAKYTFEGGLLWVSRFGEGTSLSDRQNRGTALAPFPLGGVLVGGQFFGSPDFDPGSNAFRLTSQGSADGFAVRLTPAGALALTP